VPVVAIGVPTVVDAGTLTSDLAEQIGIDVDSEDLREFGGDMIVTPKDIDSGVNDIAQVIGYALNLAIHESITIDDVNMLLG